MTAHPTHHRASPSLIVTLGPVSTPLVKQLVQAGADTLRINGSHTSPEDLERILKTVRKNTDTPIVVDLQGAKMRLGEFSPVPVLRGQSITLASNANDADIPCPHPELFRDTHPGDTLRIDDDRLRLRVDEVHADHLLATCLSHGLVQPRKGINVVEHPVALDDLTLRDVEQVRVAAPFGVSFACSFMLDGREASWIRERAPGAKVIGKIERAEALDHVASIARCVDALWICRGDLGAQVGMASMARWVAAFRPTDLSLPVFMAGQVLEHLTDHAGPTRSEVCHLHDLMQRGYAGVVLSDETAMGRDPVHATSIAKELLISVGRG